MRILVISNLYPPAVRGGYEVLCAETVKRLQARHEVTVLTSRAHGVPADPHVIRELDLLPPGPRSALRAPLATLHGVRVTGRLLEALQPELIFVWNGAAIPHAVIRVCQFAGVPMAFSVAEHWFGGLYRRDQFMRHLMPGESGLRGVWARGIRLFNRHPALRIDPHKRLPASICWVSEALRRGVPLPSTVEPLVERVIYTGVHAPELWAGVERRPPTSPPTIAFVGRLEEQKGPAVAYRALAALRDRHGIDAQLKLAGRGTPDMLAQLEQLARDLGIRTRVELLGQLDQAGVASLLAGASAIVAPSTWQEPSGGVCLEAGLARVPVVASRSGGMPEGLREDEHALYFPIGDAAGCADALARVLGEPEETQARAARAFERARQFSFDSYMAQMDEFLSAAIDAHGRPAREPTARHELRRGLRTGAASRRQTAT
jgi:glycosyltransferase involved in cell wall biosynthesis